MRLDWEYQAHDKWLPPTQDPNTAQYDPANFTLPSTSFFSLRAGMKFGDFHIEPFIDNLSDTHVPINYNWSVRSSTRRHGRPTAGCCAVLASGPAPSA